VIAVIVGLLLLPVVQDTVTSSQELQNNTTSESQQTLLGVITLFYVLGIVLGAVLYVVSQTVGFGRN
jgi:hypothetical protein